MGIFGNELNKLNENDYYIEIFVDENLFHSLLESGIILEDAFRGDYILDSPNGRKQIAIHIRNREGCSRAGAEANHGPSIKVMKVGMDSNEGLYIKIPIEKDAKVEFDDRIANTKLRNEIERKYDYIFDFVSDNTNARTLRKLWDCKTEKDYEKYIAKLERDTDGRFHK